MGNLFEAGTLRVGKCSCLAGIPFLQEGEEVKLFAILPIHPIAEHQCLCGFALRARERVENPNGIQEAPKEADLADDRNRDRNDNLVC